MGLTKRFLGNMKGICSNRETKLKIEGANLVPQIVYALTRKIVKSV
jgi:hypothetical protein